MKVALDVGSKEKHKVTINYNQFWGILKIYTDGVLVKRDIRIFSFSLVKTYKIKVGRQEEHIVKLEQTRKLVLAGFRRVTYRIFPDGEVIRVFKCY